MFRFRDLHQLITRLHKNPLILTYIVVSLFNNYNYNNIYKETCFHWKHGAVGLEVSCDFFNRNETIGIFECGS